MATVLITGGRGWLGHLLAQEILRRGELQYGGAGEVGERRPVGTVVALDVSAPEERHRLHGLVHEVGDVTNAGFVASLFRKHSFDSIFHLAAVLSGQAELDFDLGMKVNVDATRGLLECCRRSGTCPTLVMASSVAVFGSPSVSGAAPASGVLSEDTPALPRSSYGMEKAVCELLLSDASRRGLVDARTVRLPTIVVRPGKSSATSSFCSAIIREPLRGERTVCPVARDLPLWVQSPQTAIGNLVHAHNVRLGQASRIITLPGLTTTPEEMVAAVAALGADSSLVDWAPDAFLSSVVASWPGHVHTPTATALGFNSDKNIATIVKHYVDTLEKPS